MSYEGNDASFLYYLDYSQCEILMAKVLDASYGITNLEFSHDSTILIGTSLGRSGTGLYVFNLEFFLNGQNNAFYRYSLSSDTASEFVTLPFDRLQVYVVWTTDVEHITIGFPNALSWYMTMPTEYIVLGFTHNGAEVEEESGVFISSVVP